MANAGLDSASLLSLSRAADEVLEQCVRDRLSLRATLDRFLPAMVRALGATGAAVLTRDEALTEAAFCAGELSGDDAWTLLAGGSDGARSARGGTLVSQRLDVAGKTVGSAGFLFRDRDRAGLDDLVERVRCVCE